ncbi:MAG: sulfite exporter TauE/SafE family protein [Candidatus Kapaibacterium sp.]
MGSHTTLLITLLIGASSGLSSGMFGIGGALLATPLLKIFVGLPAVLALATPLPAAIPSAISGTMAYGKKKLLRFDVAWRILIPAIPGSLIGSYITRFTPGAVLMVATGVMVIYTAYSFLRRGLRKESVEEADLEASELTFGPAAYGWFAFAGFLSGFLAIGGGMVLVPAMVKIVGLSLKQALGTSLLCVAALAVPGVIVHGLSGHIDWMVALILSVTVIPMSYLGASIATRIKSATLSKIYGAVMLAFAVYFIISSLLER